MKTLKVPEMHCEKCVARISNALSAEQIAFEISLADKCVAVAEDKVSQAVEILDDLGFSAE